ncbi:hypothetical protein KL948_003384 [Ogataea haglerorum]|nr:hypothetical protein KL948_003384 [Ogataea haglerorum]
MSSKTELPEYAEVTLPREEVEKLYKIKNRYETNKKIAKLGLGVFLFFVACLVLKSGSVFGSAKSLTHPRHSHAHGFHGDSGPSSEFEHMRIMDKEHKPFKKCKGAKIGRYAAQAQQKHQVAEGEVQKTEHELDVEEHNPHQRPHSKGMKSTGHKKGKFSKKKQNMHLKEEIEEKMEKEPKDEEEKKKIEVVEKQHREKHRRPARVQEEVLEESSESESESEMEN